MAVLNEFADFPSIWSSDKVYFTDTCANLSILPKGKQELFKPDKPVEKLTKRDLDKTIKRAFSSLSVEDFDNFRSISLKGIKKADGDRKALKKIFEKEYPMNKEGFASYLYQLFIDSGLYYIGVQLYAKSCRLDTKVCEPKYAVMMWGMFSKMAEVLFPAGHFALPSTAAMDLFVDTINAGDGVRDMPARKSLYTKVDFSCKETASGRLAITAETSKSISTIEITDISKIGKNNKDFQKLFLLFMVKAKEQAVGSDGVLRRPYIEFPLQELVDNGFYKSIESARKGVKSVCGKMGLFSVSGNMKLRGKRDITEGGSIPFTGWCIKRGVVMIQLNPMTNWSILTYFYTCIPSYYPQLSSRSLTLLYKIAFLCRQNTAKIKKDGWFTMSYRAIQQYLNLPHENQTKNPERDIKQRIEEAVIEIEDMENKSVGIPELQFEQLHDDTASITDFLDSGRLKVIVNGSMREELLVLEDTKTTKRKEAAKKTKPTKKP